MVNIFPLFLHVHHCFSFHIDGVVWHVIWMCPTLYYLNQHLSFDASMWGEQTVLPS